MVPGDVIPKSRSQHVLLYALALLAACLFAYVVLSHAVTDGLCCGDDAAIALAAKSLAQGDGYSIPLNFIGESGRFRLHHGLSTGPTLVLPAALLISIAGPQVWAPSVASATVSLMLLLTTVFMIRRVSGAPVAARFALLLLVSLYILTSVGGLFVHWYSLLGEIPALLLLVLAAWFAASMDEEGNVDAGSAFVAGLLAGLAVNSKLLALLGALSIGGLYAYGVLRVERYRAFRAGVVYTFGLMLPLLAFELFRLKVLGGEGYMQWLYGMRDFFGNQAPGAASGGFEPGTLGRAKYNYAAFTGSTGIGWLLGVLPLVVVFGWLHRDRQNGRLARMSLVCGVAGAVYVIWWLFHSNGWPRYALIGLGLLVSAGAAGAAAARKPARRYLGVALVLAVVPWSSAMQLAVPFKYAFKNGFTENERVAALRQVDRYLDQGAGREAVVAGSWWASVVAIEYMSDDPRRTAGFNRLYTARPDLPGTLMLVSPQWDAMAGMDRDPAFQEFMRVCPTIVLSAPPYELRRCDMVAE